MAFYRPAAQPLWRSDVAIGISILTVGLYDGAGGLPENNTTEEYAISMMVLLILACLWTPTAAVNDVHAAWRFRSADFLGGTIPDTAGSLPLRLEKGGLTFAGAGAAEAMVLGPKPRELSLFTGDLSTVLPPEAFSVSVWARMDAVEEWAGLLSAVEDNGNFERGWVVGVNSDRFFVGLATSPKHSITYLYATTPAELGRWHHVVATYDGTAMRLFIDGVLEAVSFDQKGPVAWADTASLVIGAYKDADERHPFHGAIHSASIHTRALSAEEISVAHTALADVFPEPATPEDIMIARPAEDIVGWPTYRRDPSRSAATTERLDDAMFERWRLDAAAPMPSWSEPMQRSFWQNIDDVVPRVVFDLANHPVSNGSEVVFGSSRTDHVTCLDLQTGATLWTFATEGPIRFAPIIDGDGVIVASDDGFLYRIALRTGDLLWKTHLAPEERRLPGNGRLISTWPIRTGPVLDRGVLHASCGLFPKFGTWAFGLDPATGDVLWKVPMAGISPQGYLLASSTRLFVPTGRTAPHMLGRGDGRDLGAFSVPGGTFALLVEDELVAGPGSKGILLAANTSTKETAAQFEADRGVITPELIVLHRGEVIRAIDRTRLKALQAERKGLVRAQAAREAAGKSIDELRDALASNSAELTECGLWQRSIEGFAIAKTAEGIVIGSRDEVVILDASTGADRWSAPINGRGTGLAVANGHLLVATDRGTLHAFGLGGGITVGTPPPTTVRVQPNDALLRAVRDAAMDRGLAIVLEPQTLDDALCLATETDLHVVVISSDPELRDAARSSGLYGDRLVVLESPSIIDHVANVVISNDPPTDAAVRLVRPDGGILLSPSESLPFTVWTCGALDGAQDWSHPYAGAGNSASNGDARVSGDAALQWFGGPGPARMVDRHLRTTASLAAGGRMFIPANDTIIAVDAYNGIELWETPLEGFTRTGAPLDGGWWALDGKGIFAAVADHAVRLDQRTGAIMDRLSLPVETNQEDGREWGWLAVDDGLVLGSAARPEAARREQSRAVIQEQYNDHQSLAVSQSVFAIDPVSRETKWVHHGDAIPNTTLAVHDGRVYFLESVNAPSKTGRLSGSALHANGIDVVALDATNGEELWRTPVDNPKIDHSVFLAVAHDTVVVTSSFDRNNQIRYRVATFDPKTGVPRWQQEHDNNRQGTDGHHGEVVHHPVILEHVVVAEPMVYDLLSGEPIDLTGKGAFAVRGRSGCGTISASKDCLFFRNGNPSVIELREGGGTSTKLTESSRPGCWINIIPSQGLILMPESSAGCVCGFSLQTSMALVPTRRTGDGKRIERQK